MNYLVDVLGIYGLTIGLMAMMQGGILDVYGRWIASLPEYISKPMGLCVQCFGTWVFIILITISNFMDIAILIKLGLFYLVIEVMKPKKTKIR